MFKKLLIALVISSAWLGASQSSAEEAATIDAGTTSIRDAAIARVVKDQLAAFEMNDSDKAFSYASPNIRATFGSAERFIKMVKFSYGMIHNPAHYQLEGVEEREGKIFQKALFAGTKSRTVRAWYEMEQQEDGAWKINGVALEKSEDRFV